MTALGDYIRNLAVFLIFASFITIISPGEKFEKYVNLVLGIILILVLVAPLSGVIGAISGSSGDIFADISLAYDRAAMARQIEQASHEQQETILALFTEGLAQQTGRLVDNHGHFYLEAIDFTVNTADNFGEILQINLTLRERGVNAPFLRIDPVRITQQIGNRGEVAPEETGLVENPQIISLRNLLGDFYNLAVDNIYIETMD
ncbi:MAG: stage III sporulation protein AF [Defluviitaleaceae bacterium]|nr:stage III sporulation protein AF [Defluviitaleaceae bacterium]